MKSNVLVRFNFNIGDANIGVGIPVKVKVQTLDMLDSQFCNRFGST